MARLRYCPAGHGEFEEWVERCPECQRPLTETSPSERPVASTRDDEPVAYLATAPNELIARMWLETLETAGIQGLAKALGPGLGAWASAMTMEHALYVMESRVGEARDIISDFEGMGFDDAAPDSPFVGRRR